MDYEKKFYELRKKAEESLKEKKISSKKLALEINELIHELEVHQIELEMQNEDLIKTQRELEESRRDYYELYDFAPVGYFTLDRNGLILKVNLAGAKILGLTRDELINRAFIFLITPQSKKTFYNHCQEVMNSSQKKYCEIEILDPEKNPLAVSLDSVAVLNGEGGFEEFRTILTDINNRKIIEKEIEESRNELQATIDAIPDILFEVDEEGRIYDYKASDTSMLFIPPEKFLDKTIREVLPSEAAEKCMQALKEAAEEGKHQGMTYQLKFPDKKRYFELSIAKKTANQTRFIALARDITIRKTMEKELKKSLEEKELLLKEIHHRVKNNLMVMSGLLSLQSEYIKDKAALEVFKESQHRAQSMAMIHEHLYSSNDLKRINFGEYITTLTKELYLTYVNDSNSIALHLNIDNIMVDVNIAVPLGLIVNELVSNSMKYAFPGDMDGIITIDLHKALNELELVVSDNGVGLPKEMDYKNTDSLGMQLVNNLTSQIDGKIDLDTSKGTKFTIKFVEDLKLDL
jgi:PAS domain S-box-containing protein